MVPVEKVKQVANIVDVVSDYVRLEAKGETHWGLCPFHKEKTPSFSISEEKGLYYCFGCGAGGDLIDFVERIEGVSFVEAVHILAAKYGIDTEEEDDEYAVLRSVWDYMLANKRKADGFLRERGISVDEVGYDDGGWVSSVDPRIVKKLGIGDERNGRAFSWFKGRVIFPVRSGGRLVGFTGRTLRSNGPKWFHSNFSRKSTVFLLDERRREIKDAGFVVVVEGPLDAYRLWNAGVPAVAIFGARLSDTHASKIAALGVDIYLGLDRDGAGLDGSLAAVNLLRGRSIIRVILWPERYKDPGEIPQEDLARVRDMAVTPGRFVYGYAKWKHRDLDRVLAWLKPWLEPVTYADPVPTELSAIMKKSGVVLPSKSTSEKPAKKKVGEVVERERLLEADIAAVLMSVQDVEERRRLANNVEIGVLPSPGDMLVGVLDAVRSSDPVSVFRKIGAGGIFYRRIIEAPPYSSEEAERKLTYLVRLLSIRKLQRAMHEAFEAGDTEAGLEFASALEATKRSRRA